MRNGYPIIDADRHLMEPPDLWVSRIDKKYRDRAPFIIGEFAATVVVDGITNNGGTKFNGITRDQAFAQRRTGGLMTGFSTDIHWRYTYYDAMVADFSNESYIRDMDRSGVDAAVCFGSAQLYFNWRDNLEPDYAEAICRAYNDWLAEYRSIAPDRIFCIASVPMQDVKLAVKEAQRAIGKLGHVGLYLRPNPLKGKQWHDPEYDYFYAAVAELGKPICFHEGGSTNMTQARLPYNKTFYARHAMSHPFENMLACLSFCGLGVFERHPRLKAFFAECTSGWIPFWIERMDRIATHKTLGADVKLKEKPSFYFKRQGVVSCEAGEETLASSEGLVGTENMMWASDYPHPDEVMKFPHTVLPMFADEEISKTYLRKILWDNPNRFFGLGLEAKSVAKEAAD